MLNNVVLIGRLVKDPELRFGSTGVAVCTFVLAVDRPFTNSETKEREADFLTCVAWRQLGETAANYLRKGRLTAVTGRIQTRNYENAEGRKIYVTEIIAENIRFLESNKDNAGGSGSSNSSNSGSGRNNAHSQVFEDDGKPIDISSDDLPF